MYLVVQVNRNPSVSSPKWHEALVVLEMQLGVAFGSVLTSAVIFAEALLSSGRGC